jgi:hypothetical protein
MVNWALRVSPTLKNTQAQTVFTEAHDNGAASMTAGAIGATLNALGLILIWQ